MDNPFVSTLVPVYNARKFLPEMVESLRMQTYKNHEVILVDDCSSDESYAYLKEVEEKDKRFRVFQNEINSGPSATINKAAQYANGELLARLDSDDIALPQRIEIQVRFLQENPEVGFVGSNFYKVNSEGKRIGTVKRKIRSGAALQALPLFVNTFCHSTVMYRRQLFESIGGYNENLRAALDYDLLARLSTVSIGHILPQALVRYRIHLANISSQQFLLQRANAAAVQQQLLDHYGFVYSEVDLETHRQATIYSALPDYQVDVEALERIREWLMRLQTQNEKGDFFSTNSFDRVLEIIHNQVFARKNTSLTLQDYLRNFTRDFSANKPANIFLHVLHSAKNGFFNVPDPKR